MNDERTRLGPETIRREVLELLGYPEWRGGVTVRVSIDVVQSRHASAGTLARLHIDINEGARKFDLVLMLERLYMPLEQFSDLVLAPLCTRRYTPATKPRGPTDGQEKADEEEHREETHAALAPL